MAPQGSDWPMERQLRQPMAHRAPGQPDQLKMTRRRAIPPQGGERFASKTPTTGRVMLQRPKPVLCDAYPYQNRFKKNNLRTLLMSQLWAALELEKLDHSPSHHPDDIDTGD
jgi:hypothetical protein